MNQTPIIRCRDAVANISGFHYDGNPLSLDAFAGEIINIIGPDYSGKSAWIKMLCGIETSYSGMVSIFDKAINSYARSDWINLRKNMAYIDSDTALLSAANALSNVMIPALYHNMGNYSQILTKAEQLLDELVPDAATNVLPAELRKDQRYKIAIARALILRPQALILDSPFTLLDITAIKRLKDYLLKYADENKLLIIIVSHDIQFALKHSDKILFASKNKLELFDGENDIRTSDDPEIKEFLTMDQ